MTAHEMSPSAKRQPEVGLRGHRILDPERSEARRTAVLHAAALVFATKGFHACTTRDIANAIGVTKGVVYYYFRSKEEIFLEVVGTAVSGAIERLEAIVAQGASATETLHRVIASHLAYNLNHDEEGYYAMLVISDLRRTSDDVRHQIRALQRGYVQRFATVIQRGIDEGEFEPLDAHIATLAILNTINYASDWYRPEGRLGRQQIIDQISRQLLYGVLRHGPACPVASPVAADG